MGKLHEKKRNINSELIPVLQHLLALDEIDKIFYSHYKKTGQQFRPTDGASVKELLILSGFFTLSDNDLEMNAALREGDFDKVAMTIFSESWMFPEGWDIILTKSVRYCDTKEHHHDYYEIECVLSGEAYHCVEGAEVVIQCGDAIVVPPYARHDLRLNADATVINIGIRKTTFHKSFRQFLEDNLPLSQYFQQTLHGNRYMSTLVFHCGDDLFWQETLLWLYKQHMEKQPYARQIINRLTQAGLYYIMQRYAPQQPIVSDKHFSSRMDEIYRYLDTNYTNATLQAVSEQFNLSVPYLSSSIKRYFGETYSALLRSIRLRHACELLESTDMRVIDICHTVGYGEESHFIQIFKGKYGVTPKQYQMHHRRS